MTKRTRGTEQKNSDQSDLELRHHTLELEIHPIQLTPHFCQLTTLPPARTCMVDVWEAESGGLVYAVHLHKQDKSTTRKVSTTLFESRQAIPLYKR